MRKKLLFVVVLLVLLTSTVVAASAGGHNKDQLVRAGWFCTEAGLNDWWHCFKPGFDPTSESLNVKVFTAGGGDTFLGTELLIRDDIYKGQPCAQDGGGEYDLLPAGEPFPVAYRACHHFDTSG